MTILGLIAGLLTLFGAGFGLTLLASRGRKEIHLPEACAAGWLLGTGAISLLLWLGGIFVSGLALQLIVTALALGLAVTGWVSVKRQQIRLVWPAPRGVIEWLLAAIIVLQCGVMLYLSLSHGLGWDGLFNWEIKARYAFLNDGVMPASYYSDASRFVTHPAYPLWIPLNELWLYLWMGEAHQFWIKLLFPPYCVAGVILLARFGSFLTGRRWIGLLAAALLFFVPCLTNTPGGVPVGYVDVPISILYLAVIGFLAVYAQTNEPAVFRFSALTLALLPWAKKEGALLWVIAAACAALVIFRSRRWSALLWLVPGAMIIAGWKVFCAAMAIIPSHEFDQISFSTLATNLPRLDWIWRRLAAEFLEVQRWSVFWPIVGVAFVSLLWRRRDQRFYLLVFAICAPLASYTGSFAFSAWPDWASHMDASMSRLLLHVMPLAFMAIALALEPPATEDGALPRSDISRRSQNR